MELSEPNRQPGIAAQGWTFKGPALYFAYLVNTGVISFYREELSR